MLESSIISQRKLYSTNRLEMLQNRIADISCLASLPELCIYVTGSYGRREASEHSDLDIFFLNKGSKDKSKVSNISKILLDAELIKACRDMSIPEFSEDGQYLQIHYLDDMTHALGSPDDDFSNYFTARLLLILESYPLHNTATYLDIVNSLAEVYFRDYHDHHKEFKPIFLANDVIRFWKTLCLNYEHKRNRPSDDPSRKIKNHIKNLKLKFSRLMTCFSMIYAISLKKTSINTEQLVALIQATPTERIITAQSPNDTVKKVMEEYSWFLNCTNRSSSEMFEWIKNEENRIEAFSHARDFGNAMYSLLEQATGSTEAFRFLVI